MKTKGRVAVYLQTILAAVMLTCIFSAHTAYAELTEQEKNSSYGFFLWLSENQELSEADRTDAAVAAQLLKGTVSSNYSGQVFNNGSISAGSGEPGTDYSVVLQKTSIGAENDATTLDNVREAISLIKLGNTYRAKEDLHALNVSSSLMAMSEVNANYQFTKWGHTLAFNALENLSTKSRGSTQGFPSPEYDPYVGWYTEEKNNLETNNGGQTGHYLTLTDRKGTMFLTGFGYTYGHSVDTYNWTTAYCSQHFSDNSRHCSIGEGITPDDYLTYLRRYQCSLEGHEIDTTKATITEEATCLEDGLQTGPCKKCGETVEEVIPKLGHDLKNTAAKEATCTEAGNTEYYTCSRCEKLFSDEVGKIEITQADTVVAALGHAWAEEYTVDTPATCTEAGSESKHCTRCGESDPESVRSIQKLPHSYGTWTTTKDATCTEAGSKELVCSACGYKITDTIPALGHAWAEEYTVDTPATCTAAGSESKHCTRCGESDPESVRSIQKLPHSYGTWTTTKDATCTEDGSKELVCSACGYKITDTIPALGHAWAEEYTVDTPATCTEAGSESKHCTRCGESDPGSVRSIEKLPHSYGTWTTTKYATCTEAGSKELVCSACGYKITETIPATGHTWKEEYTIDKEATCTEEGSKSQHCSVCDAIKEDTVTAIPKADHNYGEWKVTEDATCTEDGSREKVCTVCKDKITETIPATGHKWAEEYTVDTPATCTAAGSESKHCTRCGESDPESVRTIEKLPHSYGTWTTTKDATCTEAGSKELVCSACGYKITETIPATGHVWAEEYTVDTPATCTEEGSESKHCSVCDAIDDSTVTAIPKADHKYGEWKVTEEASCTEGGSQEKVCSVCKDKIIEAIPALGHKWADAYTVDKPATCTEEGSESKHCSVCNVVNESTVRAVPKADHKYGEWTVTKEANCTEEGSQEKVCVDCGDKVSETIKAVGHKWSDWTVITPATTSSKGTKERTCTVCSEKETQEIPKQEEPKAVDGTAVGKGASAAAAEAAIVSAASDEGPSGTTFVQLSAKVKKAKNTSITLSWNRAAPKYVIYGNKCGKGQKFKKLATVTGTSYTQNGLVKGTYYKYMVVAVDAGGRVVATSKTMHAVTSGKKAGNPKKVTVKKKTLNLKPGKKAKIKASIVKPNGKKVKNHRKLSYESMNPKVATVAKNGSVKAVAKGTTYIYVYAQNGVYAKVKVKVK